MSLSPLQSGICSNVIGAILVQVTLFLWNRFLEPLVSPRVHFSLTRERDRLAAIQKELPDEGKDQTPNRHNFQYYVTKMSKAVKKASKKSWRSPGRYRDLLMAKWYECCAGWYELGLDSDSSASSESDTTSESTTNPERNETSPRSILPLTSFDVSDSVPSIRIASNIPQSATGIAESPTIEYNCISSPTSSLPTLTRALPTARISDSMSGETSSTRSSGVDLGDPLQAPRALEHVGQLDAASFRLPSTPVPVENDKNEDQSDLRGELQLVLTGIEDSSSCLDGLASSLSFNKNEDQSDLPGYLRSVLEEDASQVDGSASSLCVTATLDQDKAPKFKQD